MKKQPFSRVKRSPYIRDDCFMCWAGSMWSINPWITWTFQSHQNVLVFMMQDTNKIKSWLFYVLLLELFFLHTQSLMVVGSQWSQMHYHCWHTKHRNYISTGLKKQSFFVPFVKRCWGGGITSHIFLFLRTAAHLTLGRVMSSLVYCPFFIVTVIV